MGVPISVGALANHWTFRAAMEAVQRTMKRREYQNPGPGMSKQELVDAVMQIGERDGHAYLTPSTVASYVQAMGRYGYLDVTGNGKTRRFYTPGYLPDLRHKRQERKSAIDQLKELLGA